MLSVKHFLSNIEYMNDDIYRIDGYGNAENVSPDYHKDVLSDIFTEITNDYFSREKSKEQEYEMEMGV